jgi:uncharacterized protein YecT (DUF1311 family)
VIRESPRGCRYIIRRLAGLTLALLFLSAFPGHGRAQSPGASTCWRAAETQADMTRCASEDARRASGRLERLLAELRRTVDPRAFPEFDRTQAAWLAYARSHCRWDGAAFEGGSMHSMVVSGCLAAITEQRIATLKPYLCGWPPEAPDCDAARSFEKP